MSETTRRVAPAPPASGSATALDPPHVPGRGVYRSRRLEDTVRRALDLLIGVPLLVVLAPFGAVIGLLVRLTSPGPALFVQERVGWEGRSFRMLKFRTMAIDNDDTIHREYVSQLLTDARPADGGRPGVYKLHNDPRVTSFGRVLRATSLDELPQLINVVRGDMSLVGPRPVLQWEVDLYEPHHLGRFVVKPGLTGLWQVRGHNRLTMREALDIDLEYVRQRSLLLDFNILIRTAAYVLRR